MSQARRERGPARGVVQVLGALAILLLQGTGSLSAVDRAVIGRLAAWREPPDRAAAPLRITVDQAAVDLIGPLPWDLETWQAVAERMGDAGLTSATVVDPWPRLARLPAAGAPLTAGCTLFVPRQLRYPGPEVLQAPPAAGPFEPREAQLSLPAGPDGVIRDLSRAASAGDLYGASALCAWGACPEGGAMALPIHPLPEGAIPTLSLAVLLAPGPAPRVSPAPEVVLLGLDLPFTQEQVRLGPDATGRPWSLAVAEVTAIARSRAPARSLPWESALAILLLVMGLSHVGTRTSPLPLGLAAVGATAGTGLALVGAGVLVPPLAGASLAAALPPLIHALTARRVALDFLGNVGLILAQDGFRYAWRDTRVRKAEDLLLRLGALTRNHTTTGRMAWLPLARGAVRWGGGYGMGPEQVRLEGASLASGPFGHASRSADGADASGLLTGDMRGRLVALWQKSELVGFWLVLYGPEDTAAPPRTLARLGGWISLQLALPVEERGERGWLADRLSQQAALVQRLLSASSEERRRQVQALHAIDLPLLTADISGTIQFANRAMTRRLDGASLSAQTTLRGVLYHILPKTPSFSRDMRNLFAGGQAIHALWESPAGPLRVVARPVLDASEEGRSVLGYILYLEDLSLVRQVREMRGSVLHFTATKVRNSLMVVSGYADLLQAMLPAETRAMAAEIGLKTREIHEALQELEAVARQGEDDDTPHLINLSELLRALEEETAAERGDKRLRVDAPPLPLPVYAALGATREALLTLLREAIAQAPEGSEIALLLDEQAVQTSLSLSWGGAGLDPEVLARCTERCHEELTELPPAVQPFAKARQGLRDLRVESVPGEGVRATLSLPRGRP